MYFNDFVAGLYASKQSFFFFFTGGKWYKMAYGMLRSHQIGSDCGVCSVSAGWLSWFGNSLVIFVLYRQRALLQPTDFLTLNLAVSDASISVFGYSRGILEVFNIFRDDGYLITWIWTCQVTARQTGLETCYSLI